MNTNEKKRLLKQFGHLYDNMQNIIDEISTWREISQNISPVVSGMPHSSSGSNKIQKAAEEIERLEMMLNDKIYIIASLRASLENAIDKLKSEDYRMVTILTLLYIGKRDALTGNLQRIKLTDLPKEMGYSYDTLRHIHGVALLHLDLDDFQKTMYELLQN